jgi:hypothetical protein
VIHLYAFAAGLAGPPPDGVETVGMGRVQAVFGRSMGDTRRDVIRHGRVLEALLEHATAVLPARFGERFPTVEALEAAMAARREQLEAALARVEGCVELAVRVGRDADDSPRRRSDGREYMRARLHVVAEEDALVSSLDDALREWARATAVARQPASALLHDASYLVDRDAVGEFAAAVDRYAAAYPELAVVCTGPWPPASFAEVS